jgi:hypothetical protein
MAVTACATQAAPHDPGLVGQRLASRNKQFSDWDHNPRIAVASGDYDQIECVLKRMGIEELDLYDDRGDPLGGSHTLPPTIGTFKDLVTNPNLLAGYNLVVVNCTDDHFEPVLQIPGVLDNLEHYVASGGRLYATDWAYDVIHQVPAFAPYMCFVPGGVGGPAPATCDPQPSTPAIAHSRTPYSLSAAIKSQTMRDWLANFPSTITPAGEVPVEFGFVVIAGVGTGAASSVVWANGPIMSTTTVPPVGNGIRPITVTFDYKQCGRVHYSTYNTEPSGTVDPDSVANRFPSCGSRTTFYPQERLLEYLLFEVSECLTPVQ